MKLPPSALPSVRISTLASEPDATRELILRARGGEAAALDRVLARCLPRVTRWAHGRLPTHLRRNCDTRDLLQDVALHAFRRLPSFEAERPGAFDAYLRRGVVNRIRDEVRKGTRTPPPEPLEENVASTAPSPLASMVGAQTARRYRRAMAQLSPRDRRLVVGRVTSGWGPTTAATALGFPSPAAAGVAMRRALTRLSTLMAIEAQVTRVMLPTKTKRSRPLRGSAASGAGTDGWREPR